MNPSIKRLLGALLLIGTLGVTSMLAIRTSALTDTVSHNIDPALFDETLVNKNLATGDPLDG